MPQLTMDRRKELVKEAKAIAEEAKIAVRNIRKDILNSIEEEREDEVKRIEKEVQEKINEYNHFIDKETYNIFSSSFIKFNSVCFFY